MKSVGKIRAAALAVGVLGVALSCKPANAQKLVTVYSDGAWCQTTQGQGTDNVWMAATLDKVPADGNWSADGLKTWSYQIGTYNDHGGPAHQEMQKATLARFVLQPGDSAEVVVGVYGHSNGGFFAHLGDVLKKLGPTIAGLAVGASTGNPAAALAIKAGGDKAAEVIASQFKSADSDDYVGSARITITNDEHNNVTYTIKPEDYASDRGKNPQGSETIGMKHQRGEYWEKIGVRF